MSFPKNQQLVFMPGLDGTGLSFEPIFPLLPADTKITIVRYPADRLLSFEETVEYAAMQLPADDFPVVIAESFSGPVAIHMIASGRVRVRALVLCATFARSPHPFLWHIARFLRLPLAIRPDMPRLFFKFLIGNDELIAKLLPLWKKVHAQVPARIFDYRLSLINNIDLTEELKKLAIPCLYLQATRDRLVPASCLKVFTRNVPHLKIARIEAPHFILQAQPQECLRAIEDFIESHL
jgi:pimeloyl-[acyl-carrier protein] methyl ester esterase